MPNGTSSGGIKDKLDLLGTLCGVLGAVVSVVAFVLRVLLGSGEPWFLEINPFHLFVGGVGLMVFGCWAKLCGSNRP